MVFQYVLDINYAFYPGQQVIPLRNKYLPNTDKHNNIRRVSVVFQPITRYKLCLLSRPTSNTTDTLNIYKYHGRSHTWKTNTYYSDIHLYISLSLSLLLLLCYTATLLAEFYYCLPTDYSFLLNNTPLLPTYFPLPLYNPTPHWWVTYVDNYRCFANQYQFALQR